MGAGASLAEMGLNEEVAKHCTYLETRLKCHVSLFAVTKDELVHLFARFKALASADDTISRDALLFMPEFAFVPHFDRIVGLTIDKSEAQLEAAAAAIEAGVGEHDGATVRTFEVSVSLCR
jgi:hypothetical protein